jgi:hypothetical protein
MRGTQQRLRSSAQLLAGMVCSSPNDEGDEKRRDIGGPKVETLAQIADEKRLRALEVEHERADRSYGQNKPSVNAQTERMGGVRAVQRHLTCLCLERGRAQRRTNTLNRRLLCGLDPPPRRGLRPARSCGSERGGS